VWASVINSYSLICSIDCDKEYLETIREPLAVLLLAHKGDLVVGVQQPANITQLRTVNKLLLRT
jgi:hypothetical protein